MLTLSRKAGQSICIGSEIRVCVTEVRGDKVTLSVDAPRDIPINRTELAREKGIEVPLNRRNPEKSEAPSGNHIEQAWERYVREVLPKELIGFPGLLEQLRLTFFSGAIRTVTTIRESLPTEDPSVVFNELLGEARKFKQEMEQ